MLFAFNGAQQNSGGDAQTSVQKIAGVGGKIHFDLRGRRKLGGIDLVGKRAGR